MELAGKKMDQIQKGKKQISEGMNCLRDLVKRYSQIPEKAGRVSEIMTYFQYLQQQIQEIESVAQKGGAPVSFNVYRADLRRRQKITQIREQDANFEPTLNQGIDLLINQEGDCSSSSKRKRWSNVWEHFTKYVGKDEKEWAQCKHCKKEFVQLSKSEITHLNNHLESCLGLRNPAGLIDKTEKVSVIDQELNDSNLVRRIIKYGLNGITDDILNVYEQENDKLHKYLDKLPGSVNVTIEREGIHFPVWYVTIWSIDDNWELKKRTIHLENDDMKKRIIHTDGMGGLNENPLKHLFQDWNIDKRSLSMHVDDTGKLDVTKFDKWLHERASLPCIGIYRRCYTFLVDFEGKVIDELLKNEIEIFTKVWDLRCYCLTSSNKYMYELAVETVSMGIKGASIFFGSFTLYYDLLDWIMRNKEAFCEFEHTDPDFKSIGFDWDDATSLHSFMVVLKDMENDIEELLESECESKLANECFPIIYHFFSKLLRFKKTENQYFRLAALRCRECFDEYCGNSKMLYVITVILDPRFKVDIVEHFYKEIYDNEADFHFKKIFDSVVNIYNDYAKDVKSMGRAYAFSQHANEFVSTKSEFDRYLQDSRVPLYEEFDILEWWCVNSPTYPILATMARDFLSIPIVKWIESVSHRVECEIEDIYTSKLDVELKRALICLKIWLNYPVNLE
ncbi:zinc finger BED domain-containing protein RICESLEEPER 1-like [Mangifera indica]|uniref:zinc finger BED domain-containing protein RICESLEEPER 1-like n=1 Tax=Mangifera indica TaxID=29780 RepID=UPI001CFBB4BE|nr:zinc finger BED domain-containing protein RICESLEEPER 1-like [Mangifera indica]